VRKYANVDFLLAEVTGIDPQRRAVRAMRPSGERVEIGYDWLIVGVGVEQSYFGHDEYARWAPGMKSLEDALQVRRRVFGAFEMADSATDPDERRRRLTFAVVGAGPTGVELAGQIREVATKTLAHEYRHIDPTDARVMLFDGGTTPLASFGPRLSAKAASTLQAMGIELHMNSMVTHIDGTGLHIRTENGAVKQYEAGTVLWTAGVAAPSLATVIAQATGAKQDHAGRIEVAPDLSIPQHPEILVAGDVMSLNKLPGVAEVAMQAGLYAGHRVRRHIAGNASAKPFCYHDLGSAAYISRGHAVVSVGRLQFGGFPGWMAWLFIHIAFLTGYRNRFGAVLGWWFAFTRDLRGERTFAATARAEPGQRSPDT
jgi:NADH dehydrogenase